MSSLINQSKNEWDPSQFGNLFTLEEQKVIQSIPLLQKNLAAKSKRGLQRKVRVFNGINLKHLLCGGQLIFCTTFQIVARVVAYESYPKS